MKLNLYIGELLELVGAAMGIWACDRYFGVSGAIAAIAVLSVAAAELLYDDAVLRIPLPPIGKWARSATSRVARVVRFVSRTAKRVVMR